LAKKALYCLPHSLGPQQNPTTTDISFLTSKMDSILYTFCPPNTLLEFDIVEGCIVYYVGGFGVMGWVPDSDYDHAQSEPLAEAAGGLSDQNALVARTCLICSKVQGFSGIPYTGSMSPPSKARVPSGVSAHFLKAYA